MSAIEQAERAASEARQAVASAERRFQSMGDAMPEAVRMPPPASRSMDIEEDRSEEHTSELQSR